ncbi:predicted protein [Naegleria gruberi]|uniref:Predicted protein n=1 Tax=Naegleria gruberi TaxID=5762 RepID=D2V1J8_NAEGR|nr:uncharacterized protein NAEGRDRAFT_62605 [Naegleria gruberi]EFC49322.1 predicted protein [Naegleria gruberi]|eukprot:XP_002682066.1 predicted protein [Naegleria gruberi strain NEG-M]
MNENATRNSSTRQQKLNFTNIRVLVREVIERFMFGDVSTTINDKMMIEQLLGSEQTMTRNVQKLQQKKQGLENQLERKRSELMEKAFRNYNIVDLHRKHTTSVVLAGSEKHNSEIIEHNTTSGLRKLNNNNTSNWLGLEWIIRLILSLFKGV